MSFLIIQLGHDHTTNPESFKQIWEDLWLTDRVLLDYPEGLTWELKAGNMKLPTIKAKQLYGAEGYLLSKEGKIFFLAWSEPTSQIESFRLVGPEADFIEALTQINIQEMDFLTPIYTHLQGITYKDFPFPFYQTRNSSFKLSQDFGISIDWKKKL